MKIKTRKGYALIFALVFVIIVTIAGTTLYTSVNYAVKNARLSGGKYNKVYFRSFAALRFATIILDDPDQIFTRPGTQEVFTTRWLRNNGNYNNLYPVFVSFCNDMGISPNTPTNSPLVIRIEEGSLDGGPYDVSATYTY